MRRTVGVTVMALATAIGVLVPTAVLADITEPRPRAGDWELSPLFGTVEGGGFKVTDSREHVKRVRVNPDGTNAACGDAVVRVLGRHKIRKISRGGYGAWIVGRKVDNGTASAPKRVDLEQGSATFSGRLEIGWQYDDRRYGDGQLSFSGGDCVMTFTIRHE